VTINHLKHSRALSPAFPAVYSAYVLFAPVGEATGAALFPKIVEVVVLSTACIWPTIEPLMSVTISVETSVVVPILVHVGARIKVCLSWPPDSSLLFPLVAHLRTRRTFTAVFFTLRTQLKSFKHSSLIALAVIIYVTLERGNELIF
jgi:hypothetical protein